MTRSPSFRWYIPSLFGDIELEPAGDAATVLKYEKLSDAERTALEALLPTWKNAGATELAQNGRGTWSLDLSLDAVRVGVISAMKKGATLDVVRFSNGRVTEVRSAKAIEEGAGIDTATVEAGVSVNRPTIGCPAPAFDQADVRATRVLSTFLTPRQREDWGTFGRFVCTGADTRHRYLVISRQALNRPMVGAIQSNRSVYDLDDKRPICVHDWSVPAAEECLELMLHLTTRGNETHVRGLPDEYEEV